MKHREWILWVAGAIALLSGVVLAIFGVFERRSDVVSLAIPCLAGSFGLLGVAGGVGAFSAAKQEAAAAQQVESASFLVNTLLRQFSERESANSELAEMRAGVVAWADPNTVEALKKWNAGYDDVTRHSRNQSGAYILEGRDRDKMSQLTVEVVTALRADLDRPEVDQSVLRGAIFNDRPSPKG